MLHYYNLKYSGIYEAIQNTEIEISDNKEMFLSLKKDLVHIDYRILQARRNKHTREYIPTMVNIRKYLLNSLRINQEQLDEFLIKINTIKKMIVTG